MFAKSVNIAEQHVECVLEQRGLYILKFLVSKDGMGFMCGSGKLDTKFIIRFLPRDATQDVVMPQYDDCPSVRLSVCDVQVCFSHRLELGIGLLRK